MFKTEKDKEFDNVLVVNAIAELEEQKKSVKGLVEQLFDSVCEAARLGNDDYAITLVDMIADFEEFREELGAVKLEIETYAITAKVMSKLGKLPEALEACRAVFSNAPDFKSLGKELKSLREALSIARKSVKELRAEVNNKPLSDYEKIYGKKEDDPKRKERVSNIIKMIAGPTVPYFAATQPAASPSNDKVSATYEARIDAIAAMLDGERKGE